MLITVPADLSFVSFDMLRVQQMSLRELGEAHSSDPLRSPLKFTSMSQNQNWLMLRSSHGVCRHPKETQLVRVAMPPVP